MERIEETLVGGLWFDQRVQALRCTFRFASLRLWSSTVTHYRGWDQELLERRRGLVSPTHSLATGWGSHDLEGHL
jgi:hypothetical protein